MDERLVANYLDPLRKKRGLSYEALAEESGRAVSTVKNLCLGNSEDPRIDTVAPVVYALGGSMDEMLNPGKTKEDLQEVSISALKESYEFQVKSIKETNEEHIHNIRTHYEQHHHDLRENYERIISILKTVCLILGISLCICFVILITLLIAEIMNPHMGWIQWDASTQHHDTSIVLCFTVGVIIISVLINIGIKLFKKIKKENTHE